MASSQTEEELRERVIGVLKSCYDPEIPVDIYELGLIYEIEVRPDRTVAVTMTLTSPMCPVAEILPAEVQGRLRALPGVEDATIELVWDPPWNPGMMSEAAKLELGF